MANTKDFKVKNGIQPTAYHEAVGTVVAGSEGYSIADASVDGVTFSYSSQDSFPQGLKFSSNGEHFYIAANSSQTIYQYDLSTAWDLSTVSYAKSFSHASQTGTTASVLIFKNDGTKMYIGDNINDTIYQYSLSTAWDLATASYDSINSGNISANSPLMREGYFKPDGTALFLSDQTNDTAVKYTLGTAWDISTVTYDSQFSLGTVTCRCLQLKPDGTKMYILDDDATESIVEYSLSTSWDITTATLSGNSYYYFSDFGDNVPSFDIKYDDGTKLYLLNNTDTRLEQISTASYTQTLDLSTGTYFSFTPSGATTVSFTNAPASGKAIGFAVEVNGDGSAITWPSSVKWPSGVAPTATASKEVYAFVTTDGGTSYYGKLAGSDIA